MTLGTEEDTHLKEEALDRIKWRNRFRRGCGPVVWQITNEWMNEFVRERVCRPIIGTIVRTEIWFHSRRNKKQCRASVHHEPRIRKTSGSGRMLRGPCKILNFWPLQTPSLRYCNCRRTNVYALALVSVKRLAILRWQDVGRAMVFSVVCEFGCLIFGLNFPLANTETRK